jgi:endonuclease/exonuclease/phosphatase family metal-dependent hydrolase
VAELGADVLAVIEAEDRPALQRFTRDVLPTAPADAQHPRPEYSHVMLVDGNDDRGIDVGIMTSDEEPIEHIRSHVDDRDAHGVPVFSRDCAEYELTTPDGEPLLVLVNHFKSKGFGSPAESTAKRRRQAQRVKEIYDERRAEGWKRVAIVGDFNDTPESDALAPLIAQTDLRDVSAFPGFEFGPRRGTFGTGNEKIDYILLSPELFGRVTAGGIFRKGVWHGPNVQNPWPMFDTLTRPEEAASDHAAVWAELNV